MSRFPGVFLIIATTAFSIPGPAPAAIIGRQGNLLRFASDPISYLNKAFAKFGDVVSIVEGGNVRMMTAPDQPSVGIVSAYGPELCRQVETQGEIYYKSVLSGGLHPGNGELPIRLQPLQRFMTGLFHVNGETHKQHRRLLMPAFHKRRIESYAQTMIDLAHEMFNSWQPGQALNLHEAMTNLTMQIATKTLFGVDVIKGGSEIGKSLQDALALILSPATAILQQDIPGTAYHKFLNLAEKIDQEMQRLIADKRANPCDGGDVLSMLIQAQDEDGQTLTEAEIIGHAGVIFSAGHETTANALTWTLFLLSQHPEVTADLVDELQGALAGAPPTIESLSSLPFLERVIKESLRILPPVPLNHRIVNQETTLGEFMLPVGTELFFSIYHTHHMPGLYPEPMRFNPYRWEAISPDTFEYNPFSAGPRMCIGAPFAMLEIKLVLAMMLQRFRLQFAGGVKIDRKFAITLSPKNGMPMIVHGQDRAFDQGVGGVLGNIHESVILG